MRLGEIKPHMVIHCGTRKEADMLCDAVGASLSWKENWDLYKDRTCYETDEDGLYCYGTVDSFSEEHIFEFSDLIIPELSAEEVLRICTEICTTAPNCDVCPMQGNCFKNDKCDHAKVIEICEQWKVDHEKKEPEVEWVFDCFQNSNIKNAPDPVVVETEEEAKKYCKEMAKKYVGEAFAYIPVCRVKGE